MLGVREGDLGRVPLFLSQENRSGSGEGSNRYIPGVFLQVGDFTTAYHVRATRGGSHKAQFGENLWIFAAVESQSRVFC